MIWWRKDRKAGRKSRTKVRRRVATMAIGVLFLF